MMVMAMCRRRAVKYSIIILFVIAVLNYYIVWKWTGAPYTEDATPVPLGTNETVHIGITVTNSSECRYVPLLIKSVLLHTQNPIHFHFLADTVSQRILQDIIESWNFTTVNTSIYPYEDNPRKDCNQTGFKLDPQQLLKDFHKREVLLKKIKRGVHKLIFMEPTTLVLVDIRKVWRRALKKNRISVVSEFQDQPYAIRKSNVLLTRISGLGNGKYSTTYIAAWSTHQVCLSSTDIEATGTCSNSEVRQVLTEKLTHTSEHKIKSIVSYDGYQLQHETVYELNHGPVAWHWSWLCPDFYAHKHRVHPFFAGHQYQPLDAHDVTMIIQLSLDRMPTLKKVLGFWDGPVSVSLYVDETNILELWQTIRNDPILHRENIAVHVAYKKYNSKYPINFLRNLAWRYANTPYVFLNDVDFMPKPDTYQRLRRTLKQSPLGFRAYVVPSFDTKITGLEYPKTKLDLNDLVRQNMVIPFRSDRCDRLHGPTNHSRWLQSSVPYDIQWKYDYEPYIVVNRHVTRYDERFIGFGRNKISHIEELHAQGYSFTVLPDVYSIHYPHATTSDSNSFKSLLTTYSRYFTCIKMLDKAFAEDLREAYGYIRVYPWKLHQY